MNELILVADDEPKIVKLAQDYLEQGGFRVVTAGDGEAALAVAKRERPDLVVLDLSLPRMDGLDVFRALRTDSSVPIIMLTARVDEADRLVGLELGADDYVTKPFSPRELVARVRAVLRRVGGPFQQTGLIKIADLEIDTNGHSVTRGDEAVRLTPIEFSVLATLAGRPGQTFTRGQLIDRLHSVEYDGFDRSIDSHIKKPEAEGRADAVRAPLRPHRLWGRVQVQQRGVILKGRWQQEGKWRSWPHGDRSQNWSPAWHSKRRLLFLRFTMIFGLLVLLVAGGMAALALLITNVFGGGGQTAVLVWIGGLSLSFALPVMAIAVAVRAFRGIAVPLADVMAAADDVAKGDLSTRVPEGKHGGFSRLAYSFNRMVEELERTDQMRRNLTADVAHELRTPVHIIQGNLEGVLDRVYEPTADHIGSTLEETRLLARLVDDLGTLSLAESDQLSLVRERVDVHEFLADVAATFISEAKASNIDIEIQPGNDASPITVEADVGRMQQVMGNLLANALRHSRRGGTVSLRGVATRESVRIEVEDTGEGIPADDLPFIFDRFWRGDRSRSRAETAGGGLGLAIARRLVQAHGGQIDVRSEVGLGTTFSILLPDKHPT